MLSDLWVVLFLVMLIVGIIAAQPFVLVLGVVGFLVGGVARVWSRLSLEDVDYTRTVASDPLFVGDEFEMELAVSNRKPLPMPWLRISDTVPIGLEVVGARMTHTASRIALALTESLSLAWYERVRITYRVKALRRGYHQIGPARLTSGDLFGMFVSTREQSRRDAVMVYPQTVELPDLDFPSSRPLGEARSIASLWQDPNRPQGLREYRAGDALKTVDWKATARLRSLFVRTYEPRVSQYLVLLLDVATTDRLYEGYVPRLLERLVTGAASVTLRARDLGYQVGLMANGVALRSDASMVVPPSAGRDQLAAVMTALAMVRPVAPERLEQLVGREGAALPFGSTLVLISAVMGRPLLDAVERLTARGHPAMALYVGRDALPHGSSRLPVLDMRERFDLPIADPPPAVEGEIDRGRGGRDRPDLDVDADHAVSGDIRDVIF
jgi:uncharacterized protein (DUF58 family)